ncbi:MAG: HD domain-containing protein [Bacteroidales bacterium]|nr:HD domain-containing protein [Bacteroidales bacterium]
MNQKIKIVNDPVHGFIQMPSGIGFEIVNHPYFQRLRNIKQLGVAYYVYPGAVHSRFQHSLGAYHLTQQAIEVLLSKGIPITNDEIEATLLAILLHDIGHGPFSHSLERNLLRNIHHEYITLAFVHFFNQLYPQKLNLCLNIIKNNYHKTFLHELISSQLDMDRLDYLKRDSFYTGVSEGIIGTERIIKMLTVHNNHLAVEEKGIYSIEKFLIARRLMYWQVYLHKTVLATELMLLSIFRRVNFLFNEKKIILPEQLQTLWNNHWTYDELLHNPSLLQTFAELDDSDILVWIKQWSNHNDKVLSLLSQRFIQRQLYKIQMTREQVNEELIAQYKKKIQKQFSLSDEETNYFVFSDSAENHAYSIKNNRINILMKNGEIKDIAEASDILNIKVLSKNVVKYFVCYIPECL